MAIDGIKIIDSDQGYDIYNEVVGRYRDGDHVANIIKDILDAEKDYCQTDFFTEIYWTALAYSILVGNRFKGFEAKAKGLG